MARRLVRSPLAGLARVGALALAIHAASQLVPGSGVVGQAHAADLEAGRARAQACFACHGPGGNSADPNIPALAGQPAQAISNALYQFREGNRTNPMMSPFAANLSNADMANLAAYFAAQERSAPAHQASEAVAAAGPQLTQKYNCTQCHGAKLLGQQHIPRLAGQQHDYLLTQLRGFRASTRADMDGNMTSAAQALSDADITTLADYLSTLHVPR